MSDSTIVTSRLQAIRRPAASVRPVHLFFALLLFPPASPLSASDCFCLVDEYDNLRHSCMAQKQGIREVVHCRDGSGESIRMDTLSGWERLAAGTGRCNPCRPSLGSGEGAIRGDHHDGAGHARAIAEE